eukprot:TRINITY_DN6618_c0_g1_i1.p1 TRINITY_DN6618_c0_g1~~TRINITY_DN6618_c0_g1_i1.p1  ORF type:complete len:203 (-),score=43.90 TRINITY_DN6618_c0_g1_i1:22-630(-)
MHSFCKDCLYKYLDEREECPICQLPVNVNMFDDIVRADNILQALVDKLFPDIAARDEAQKTDHLRTQSVAEKEEDAATEDKTRKRKQVAQKNPSQKLSKSDSFAIPKTAIDTVSFYLVPASGDNALPAIPNSHLKVAGAATIFHLRKLLVMKLHLSSLSEVEILCRDEILGSEHSVEYIKKTRWPGAEELTLKYRRKVDVHA